MVENHILHFQLINVIKLVKNVVFMEMKLTINVKYVHQNTLII